VSARRRILLIGEAPGKSGRPMAPALEGRAGRRLARLMGVSEEIYLRITDRVNLLPRWTGARDDTPWPAAQARRAAVRMIRSQLLDQRAGVVLLGRRVAAAFGVEPDLPWATPAFVRPALDRDLRACQDLGLLTSWIVALERAYVMPHPSGASRWWNSRRNRQYANWWWCGITKLWGVA
jgi:uracil DNA glycosylase superfamily protein